MFFRLSELLAYSFTVYFSGGGLVRTDHSWNLVCLEASGAGLMLFPLVNYLVFLLMGTNIFFPFKSLIALF